MKYSSIYKNKMTNIEETDQLALIDDIIFLFDTIL